MNKATAKKMAVRYVGANKYGEYYKVNESHNVINGPNKDRPFVCLDCRLNDCDHTEAVREHLEMMGVAA